MPCCKEDFNSCLNLPSTLPFQRNPKETFWVSTQLCSTKLTQNGKASTLHCIVHLTTLYNREFTSLASIFTQSFTHVFVSILFCSFSSGPPGSAELESPPRQGVRHPGSTTPHQWRGDRQGNTLIQSIHLGKTPLCCLAKH